MNNSGLGLEFVQETHNAVGPTPWPLGSLFSACGVQSESPDGQEVAMTGLDRHI